MKRSKEFLPLFLQHQQEILAFISILVREPHFCQDIFQEVSLVLWKQFDRYDPNRSFLAWARGIAANKVKQYWARKKYQSVLLSPEFLERVMKASEETESSVQPIQEALQFCLKKITGNMQRLLRFRYEQSLSFEQIAKKTNSTASATQRTLSRIRMLLQDCIKMKIAAN